MPLMTIEQVERVIETAKVTKRPFVVRFYKADETERVMTCLTSVPDGETFTNQVLERGERAEEDKRNKVRTVFALDVFQELVGAGKKRIDAGKQSWRRIPLNRVVRAELI